MSRLLVELDRPSQVFGYVTPNWYAAVMGTGIVANAAAVLPVQLPGLHVLAVVVWAVASVLLVVVTMATVTHWVRHREVALGHHRHPVIRHFYGAPPMALLTVGAGTLLLGQDVIGTTWAVRIDWALWGTGTVLGLLTAVAAPYLAFTRPRAAGDVAFGGWLMPVVPPMVSAATGALLLPHVPPGQARLTLLLACYAMLGLSVLASCVVITLVWGQLAQNQVGDAAMVPTLWIILGPLGQSVTGANLLGREAHLALPAPYASGLEVFGVAYGVPVLGFALMWAAVAGLVTLRTARQGLPFSLTWWSFTFPVGTFVTGVAELATVTGSDALRFGAGVLYAGLVAAWLLVAARTAAAGARGTIFLAPAQA